jgi:hypothetical protein
VVVMMIEAELMDRARERLSAVLPGYLRLAADGSSWSLADPAGAQQDIHVTATSSFAPRDVMRLDDDPGNLLVAPFLSRRSRDVLESGGYSYLDLAGNICLRVERPAVYIKLQGADRDPAPAARPPARLHGAKARRLIRLLVDVAPPYRLTDLARVGGLNKGYVSTLLETLDEQALIERGRRGDVNDVDWPALLRAAADGYQLLRNNKAALYVAPAGATALYTALADRAAPHGVVTGSFAAAALAPVAAPTQLVVYSSDPVGLRKLGRLLPAERGADVVIVQPEDGRQLDNLRRVDGVAHVAVSQLVLDCLGGNGRLPEEGEAVLDWMRADVSAWRRTGLTTD